MRCAAVRSTSLQSGFPGLEITSPLATFQLSGWCPNWMHALTSAVIRSGAQSHMTFIISAPILYPPGALAFRVLASRCCVNQGSQ